MHTNPVFVVTALAAALLTIGTTAGAASAVQAPQGLGADQPSELPAVTWLSLSAQGPIASVAQYHHISRVHLDGELAEGVSHRDLAGVPWELEFRRADDMRGVGRIPFPEAATRDELNHTDRRRLGEIGPGRYAVAMMHGRDRRSNVSVFRITGPAAGGPRPPVLRLTQLLGPDGAAEPVLVLHMYGPEELDEDFTNVACAFPAVVVNGKRFDPMAIVWTGPVAPIQPGQLHSVLIELDHYPLDAPLAEGDELSVRVQKHRSEPLRWSSTPGKALHERWDRATPMLPVQWEPVVAIQGVVFGEGVGAAGYHVHLSGDDGAYSAGADARGGFAFDTIPDGVYRMSVTENGKGQPEWVLKSVAVKAGEARQVVVDMERRHRLSGRVTSEGRPVDGFWISATWISADGTMEYLDSVKTDEAGRYELGSPFETASFVGGNGFKPQRSVKAGRTDVDFDIPVDQVPR